MIVFRRFNYLQISFSDGSSFSTTECDDSMWDFVKEHENDESAIKEKFKVKQEDYKGKLLMEKVQNSRILNLRGNSVYMLSVSELSIPEDFVAKIIEAEEKEDETELTKFKNFWTLVSLNPDSRVRNNLFWFIRKWDMQITESGLIIAYRNADIKEEAKYSTKDTKWIINAYYQAKYIDHTNPDLILIDVNDQKRNLGEVYNEIVNGDSSPIYTDHHSHTTEIRLGQPVRIPREECDAEQEHSCSRGLHVGAKGWLKQSYYGVVGLQVLVNPANVVAVPTIDDYGKMRTCEYFPTAIIDFDENGDIIENSYSLHDDIAYLKKLKYEGTINNKDIDGYEIAQYNLDRESMYENILARLDELK